MQSVLGLNIDPRMPLVPKEGCNVCIVFGEPIPVPHTPNPSETMVEEYLEIYMARLKGLHEKHSGINGTKVKPLRFLSEEDTEMPHS